MINDISYSHQDCVGKEAGGTLAKKAKLKHLSITIKFLVLYISLVANDQ